jgi:predicted hotdog family 3-hydroxylacyl-ACP dehydratase
MVLLEDIVTWDADGIVCTTTSHRAEDNPLRRDGLLPAICGIEYGAQAIAVHAGLLGEGGAGYLAGLRDIKMSVARLDDIGATLMVEARPRLRSGGGAIYLFELSCGVRTLLSGQATVVATGGHGDDEAV